MSPFESDPVRRTEAWVMASNVKPRRLSRRAWFMTGRNALCRPVDRIEAVVLVALSAAFAVAVVFAGMFGTHTYQVQRAATVGLRPAVAVLLQDGPAVSLNHVGQTEARWSVPGTGARSGVLTTETAPGIAGAAAGTRIPIWLNRSGQLAVPPADQTAMIIYALVAGALTAMLAGLALLLAYLLCRRALDRRRLAGWESAWARTGPSWTTRR